MRNKLPGAGVDRKPGKMMNERNKGNTDREGGQPALPAFSFKPSRPLLTDGRGNPVTSAHVIAVEIKPPVHLYGPSDRSSASRLGIVFEVIGYAAHPLIRDPAQRPRLSRFYPIDCACPRSKDGKLRPRSPCTRPKEIGPGTVLAKDMRAAVGDDLDRVDLPATFGLGRQKVFLVELGTVTKDQWGNPQPPYTKIKRILRTTDDHAFPPVPPTSTSTTTPTSTATSTSTSTATSTATGGPRGAAALQGGDGEGKRGLTAGGSTAGRRG